MKLFNRTVIPSDHPFVVNKYTQWYYDIIHNALFRKDKNVDYVERHHIIPDCFFVHNRSKGVKPGIIDGNSNCPSNLVQLNAREHFICHWLLTKMVTGIWVYKMESALAAFKRQSKGQQRLNTAGQYERVRKANQFPNHDYIRHNPVQHKWWTNGINQLFVINCPGPEWILGRSKSFKSKMKINNSGNSNPAFGKLWWTDGINEVKATEPPAPEYYRGRSPSIKSTIKSKIGVRNYKGSNNPASGLYWWTNGIDTVRARECPHDGWARGTGSIHRSKCSNNK